MAREIKIGNKYIGDGHPTYVVAEIGINHNGDLENVRKLIDAAKHAGVDAVNFRNATPELCVPDNQKNQMRETPGDISPIWNIVIKLNFNEADYQEIGPLLQNRWYRLVCLCVGRALDRFSRSV